MSTVLFFAPVDHFKGGAERSLFDLMRNDQITPVLVAPGEGPLADAARREGVDVEILSFGHVSEIRRPLRVTVVAKALASWVGAAWRLRGIARRRGAKIVHSNGLKAHAIAVLSRFMGGPPVVTHIRDIAVQGRERKVWTLIGRLSDAMLLVSRPCWPKDGPLPDNVTVVFNGLDLGALPKLDERGPGEALTLGFCGRLHPFKGVDTLLLWAAAARAQGLDFRLVIRGEAAAEDKPYETFLRQEADRLSLGEVVRFEGKVDGLDRIYQGLDVVVVPSVTPDPLPRSVMEAMGLGLPVIGYPAGGIPYMIDDEQNGWLVADAEAFAAVIRSLVADASLAKTFGDRAKQKIAVEFSLDRMYSQLNKCYEKLSVV